MKTFLSIIIFLNLLHCPITNKIILNPSRVKGSEAKDIIKNRLSSLYVSDISTSSITSLGYDILIPTLTGIDDNKVYSRRDVENCSTKIFLTSIAIDQPNITANKTKKATDPFTQSDPNSRLYSPFVCQLESKDKLIDLD